MVGNIIVDRLEMIAVVQKLKQIQHLIAGVNHILSVDQREDHVREILQFPFLELGEDSLYLWRLFLFDFRVVLDKRIAFIVAVAVHAIAVVIDRRGQFMHIQNVFGDALDDVLRTQLEGIWLLLATLEHAFRAFVIEKLTDFLPLVANDAGGKPADKSIVAAGILKLGQGIAPLVIVLLCME